MPDGGIDSQAGGVVPGTGKRCSAYDCEFVWLARDLRLPLVTADRKVLDAFPDTVAPRCVSGEKE